MSPPENGPAYRRGARPGLAEWAALSDGQDRPVHRIGEPCLIRAREHLTDRRPLSLLSSRAAQRQSGPVGRTGCACPVRPREHLAAWTRLCRGMDALHHFCAPEHLAAWAALSPWPTPGPPGCSRAARRQAPEAPKAARDGLRGTREDCRAAHEHRRSAREDCRVSREGHRAARDGGRAAHEGFSAPRPSRRGGEAGAGAGGSCFKLAHPIRVPAACATPSV